MIEASSLFKRSNQCDYAASSPSDQSTLCPRSVQLHPPPRNRTSHVKRWHLSLLVVILGCLAISGCGGFVGTASGNAGAGLLIALPNAVDFGTVSVGQTATATISLINKSASPIAISQFTFSGQSFSISSPSSLPITLAAGQTLQMTVKFGPTTSGTAQGQLSITSSLSKKNPSVVVKLAGTGKGANTASPTLSINATNIAFGDVALNVPSTQTVTLTSTGTLAVTINSATVTGPGFTVSGATFPLTLNAGQSVPLNVQFDPTVAGAASGQLTIASNSSTNPNAVISLSGTGVTHEVDLNWNAPSASTDPVAGYNIYRAPGGSSSYQLISSAGDTQTAYMDTTIQSGLSYDYVVKSFDATGLESSPSNTTSVTIP